MSAPLDTLEGKVEYAIMAELSDRGLEDLANLYCGHEFEEAQGSQILITDSGGAEIAFNTGVYLHRVRVAIRTPADRDLPTQTTAPDPRELHRALLKRVRDALLAPGIESRLSAQEENFTCFIFYPEEPSPTVKGRYFETETEWSCNCTELDVT